MEPIEAERSRDELIEDELQQARCELMRTENGGTTSGAARNAVSS